MIVYTLALGACIAALVMLRFSATRLDRSRTGVIRR